MSAIGLLMTPISYATLRSGRMVLDELDATGLEHGFAPIEDQATKLLAEAGVGAEQFRIERRLDMCFSGQGYEVEVSLPPGIDRDGIAQLFRETYAKTFATTPIDTAIEIVNWKVEATAPRPQFADRYRPFAGALKSQERVGDGEMFSDDTMGMTSCPIIDRYALSKGRQVTGPALIQENEATTVLGAGDTIEVDELGNLVAILAFDGDAS